MSRSESPAAARPGCTFAAAGGAAATGSSPGQGARRRAAAGRRGAFSCTAGQRQRLCSHDSNGVLDVKTYSNTWYRSVLAAGFASDSDPAGHMMLRRGIGCSQASNLNTVTFKLHFVLPASLRLVLLPPEFGPGSSVSIISK